MFDTFGSGQGFLKAGFLGFPKSGKTHTAMLLAIELRKRLAIKGPIAFLDTEAGVEYVAPRIRKETGLAPIGKKSRSFKDLMELGKACENGASSILIVDSITHIWREACDAYLLQINNARDSRNLSRRQRLEFQDWNAIKAVWGRWTEFYLNSQLHIIICGRAGFEWDFEETETTDGTVKKELVKTGVKMKVESEFGFEPSLLVEMERVQVPAQDAKDKFRFVHRARVLGDRFDVMDGLVCDNPTGDWFLPHIESLIPGAANIVDTTVKTDMGVDEGGDAAFVRERRQKNILLEEIQGEIVKALPGQSAVEKKKKVEVLDKCFGTKSWTAVESMAIGKLEVGLTAVRSFLGSTVPEPAPAEEAIS
jgi:hypothetical protein